MKRPPAKLLLEALEAREVPALFGNPWPDARNLTLSFASDGTAIPGSNQVLSSQDQLSALFSAMSAAGPASAWEMEVLKAFQTWAAVTNIDIGLVADTGNSFGSLAAAGGGIRVGAFQSTPDVVAINQPYSAVSGPWSGTLLYNTAQTFSIGDQASAFDIFSATLDEAGNIFGMADTDDPTSGLYGHYLGVRDGLNAADVAEIQSLYGGPRADAFANNNTLAAAARLTPSASPSDPTRAMVSATGGLTAIGSAEDFVFTTGADTMSLTIRLNTAGLSLLTAQVTVYDQNNNVVATGTSGGPLGGQDIVINLANAAPNQDYKVEVRGATGDVFSVGSFQLAVGYNFDPGPYASPAPAVPSAPETGQNQTMGAATALTAADSSNTKYVLDTHIGTATNVEWFQLTSPADTSKPLTVSITPAQASGLYATASVYDANGNVVASTVLVEGADGRFVLQASGLSPSSTYYVVVQAVGQNGAGLAGDYTLTADFTQVDESLSTVTAGALTATQTQAALTFITGQTRAYTFALDAAGGTALPSSVQLTIYNSNVTQVATLTVNPGSTSTGVVLLSAGTYYIGIGTSPGTDISTLNYALRAVVISDPIDPYAPTDPTAAPPPPPPYLVQNQGTTYYTTIGVLTPPPTPVTPTSPPPAPPTVTSPPPPASPPPATSSAPSTSSTGSSTGTTTTGTTTTGTSSPTTASTTTTSPPPPPPPAP